MKTRREFLWESGGGLGGVALAAMLGNEAKGQVIAEPHHKPKAKRVIQLFMAGAASHIDLFRLQTGVGEAAWREVGFRGTRGGLSRWSWAVDEAGVGFFTAWRVWEIAG